MGPDATILLFWMVSFKPTFSLFSFTIIKTHFSSPLSAITVLSSAYLRLLVFLPEILILACSSSSPVFCKMYSAYELNNQGNNMQPWHTPFSIFPEKHLLQLYWVCKNLWLCGSQQIVENSERDGNARPSDLLLRNQYASQEATVRNVCGTTDYFQIRKGVCQGCILSPHFFNLYAEYIMRMLGWMKDKLESRLPGEISITSDMHMTPPLWQKVKKN